MNSGDTITRFYEAFSHRDGAAMAACYAPEATFSDPVFTDLKGEQVGAMWQMLTTSGRDLTILLLEQHTEADTGSAHWLADYTFSRTGRTVHNDVHATFRFNEDGLIVAHRDSFNIYAWAKQALGPTGLVLGWAAPFQKTLRSGAMTTLSQFMSREQTTTA